MQPEYRMLRRGKLRMASTEIWLEDQEIEMDLGSLSACSVEIRWDVKIMDVAKSRNSPEAKKSPG